MIQDKPLISGGHDGVVSPSTENIEFAAREPFLSGYAKLSMSGFRKKSSSESQIESVPDQVDPVSVGRHFNGHNVETGAEGFKPLLLKIMEGDSG
jgi:hypothetical protein